MIVIKVISAFDEQSHYLTKNNFGKLAAEYAGGTFVPVGDEELLVYEYNLGGSNNDWQLRNLIGADIAMLRACGRLSNESVFLVEVSYHDLLGIAIDKSPSEQQCVSVQRSW
jgi:hypothetical protein